jgi:hypothetical protein
MTKRIIGLWRSLLLLGLLVAVTGFARAGTIVTVALTGTGTGAFANQPFTCTFSYEEAHGVVLLHLGTFDFRGSSDKHSVSYSINGGQQINSIPPACEPYTILTSANSKTAIQLTANTPNNSTLAILLPMGATLDQRHLPFASAFPTPNALPGSTFTMTGPTSFTGVIKTAIPSQVASAPAAPASTEPALNVAPPAYPVYTCQPQPACCLRRLFARRSCGNVCW